MIGHILRKDNNNCNVVMRCDVMKRETKDHLEMHSGERQRRCRVEVGQGVISGS